MSDTLVINGIAIDPKQITEEALQHSDSEDPIAEAKQALAIRELLRQRAVELALITETEPLPEDIVDVLLMKEVHVPSPTEADCRHWYDSHPQAIRQGDLVEARHILFALLEGMPLDLLRAKAEETLLRLRQHPEEFGELASTLSNCPSGATGGHLGQLQRGETVAEFERAVFDGEELGVLPRLVHSRYGFHVVWVERRIAGAVLPFDVIHPQIERRLTDNVMQTALRQYVSLLIGSAQIQGANLQGSQSMLVQ